MESQEDSDNDYETEKDVKSVFPIATDPTKLLSFSRKQLKMEKKQLRYLIFIIIIIIFTLKKTY